VLTKDHYILIKIAYFADTVWFLHTRTGFFTIYAGYQQVKILWSLFSQECSSRCTRPLAYFRRVRRL